MSSFGKIIFLCTVGVIAFIGEFMSQVAPHDAVSNLSHWWKLLIGNPPNWLISKTADHWAKILFIILLLVAIHPLFIWIWHVAKNKVLGILSQRVESSKDESTPYLRFRAFLERKARQVNSLALGTTIEINKMNLWYEKLCEGIKTVYGGYIPGGQRYDGIFACIKVIESRVLGFPIIEGLGINDFKETMDECHGQVALIIIELKPYQVPNFNLKDLDTYE